MAESTARRTAEQQSDATANRAGRTTGFAYNKTRQAFLATRVRVADTHWSRLCGLITTKPTEFGSGQGLWIVPCHGVHTCAMRFAIDVLYLDRSNTIVHIEENMKPWRFAPVRMDCTTVLELPVHTVYTSGTSVGDQLELAFENGNRAAA